MDLTNKLLLVLIAIIGAGSLYSYNILYMRVLDTTRNLDVITTDVTDLKASIRYIHKDAIKTDAALESHIEISRDMFLKLLNGNGE